ncbi:DUF4330 domain-containing protein [Natrinema salsiterrestre]|uniref:DUF4330 domain-containing protein n=1 Tax=Natrinema salsiterrestre TaxID=2950540 RepID=A0A9Q4Q1T8_9EURY|nr:DUF4330 domain-containing protein [Natrinema salsiterrestre]MDF9745876.1 DUF4330 domain-containing protein [Natrinema salsiterrestre]
MPLIDDEGNLFGVVNVIDALAVCLVVAVLIAGVAVVGVLGGESAEPEMDSGDSNNTVSDGNQSEPATRYATVDLGLQPDYVIEAIEEGDEAAVAVEGHNLTITDVYTSPTNSGNNGHVVVRTRIDGEYPPAGDSTTAFRFDNTSVRIGSEMTIDTADYQRTGTVQRFETEGESLETERTPVSLESNVSETTADAIESGDEYRFAGRTVATVTEVTTSDLENSSKVAVELEADLVTFNRAGTRTFGRNSLETGSQLVFRTDTYDFHGEIVRRGESEPIDETE